MSICSFGTCSPRTRLRYRYAPATVGLRKPYVNISVGTRGINNISPYFSERRARMSSRITSLTLAYRQSLLSFFLSFSPHLPPSLSRCLSLFLSFSQATWILRYTAGDVTQVQRLRSLAFRGTTREPSARRCGCISRIPISRRPRKDRPSSGERVRLVPRSRLAVLLSTWTSFLLALAR